MQRDERDLLEVLKFELNFLEKGGYGRSPKEPWRPLFVFEDSPTCMNYDSKENRAPCSQCVLMQLVPLEARSQAIPCRHIPLDANGETLCSLYAHSDPYEIEETFGKWLSGTIGQLEDQREVIRAERSFQPPSSDPAQGVSLRPTTRPKCANPACPTAFHWLGGGKFFRFQHAKDESCAANSASHTRCAGHCVKHFWLCEPCSQVFTIVYDEGQGVFLKALWPELPAAKFDKQPVAAHH